MTTSTVVADRPGAYVAPRLSSDNRLSAASLAFWIYVVLIVVILTLGGVAMFCIAHGHTLKWAQRGWTHWTIACW
jgi:hypothetical protein